MLIHPIVPDSSDPIRLVVARNQIRIARAIKGRIILMIWTIYDICYQIDFSDLVVASLGETKKQKNKKTKMKCFFVLKQKNKNKNTDFG